MLFGLAGQANAATYYVRADGLVTAGNKANATSPNASTTSLSMAQVNLASFLAGDHVLFSSQGGNYTETLVIPSGGSGAGNEVTYANVPSETPVIAITSGYLIQTNSKSNIIIDGLTANYVGLAASNNIGIYITTGSNLQFKNITSDMGSFGHVMWSSSNLSDVLFDNVNLTYVGASRYGIALNGLSNDHVTIQNSTFNTGFFSVYLSGATSTLMNNVTSTGVTIISIGENFTASNIHSTTGISLTRVDTGTISNAIGSSGWGFIFTDSSNITVNDSSMTAGASYGGFEADGTSHDITYNRDTANSNETHGFVARGTSNNITYNNCTADNNANIGFLASISASNVTYWRSEASYNGTVNVVTDGGGFLPHDAVANIKCYYCIAHHNYNEGIGDVSDGANNAYYNSTNWDNGYAIGEIFKGSTVTNPSARSNVYYRKASGSFVVNNGVFGGGKPREILNTGPSYTSLDYNLYKPVDDNLFYTTSEAITPISWAAYHPTEPNSNNSDPLFINGTGSYSTSTDYRLTYLSPAIDAGTVVAGLTTDFAGNPIYGVPDIGAYEYQPPHDLTLGTPDTIDRGAGARIYGDGKFRDLGTTNSNTAHLKIAPSGGSFETFGSTAKRPAWLDVTNFTNWTNTHKTWTENNASTTSMVTDHTVGDLNANKNYTITITGATASSITGINGTTCNNGVCRSNGSGSLSFRYTGGYSSHTFDMYENPTAPTTPALGTPTTVAIPLSWTTGGGTETVYALEKSVDGGTTFAQTARVNVPTTNYTFTSLSPNNLYQFRVAAGDGVHTTSTYATSSLIYTLANQASAPTLGTPTTSTVPLFINANGNPVGTTYAVYDSIDSKYFTALGAETATPTFFTSSSWSGIVRGLPAWTNHSFKVIARNGDNINAATSSSALATMANGGVTVSPTSIATVIGGSTATYTIVLTSAPTSTVQILVLPDASSQVSTSTIVFRSSNWNVPVTVTVTGLGYGTHNIGHLASSLTMGYRSIAVSSVTNSITGTAASTGSTGGGGSAPQSLPVITKPIVVVTPPTTEPVIPAPQAQPEPSIQTLDPSNLPVLLERLNLTRNTETEDLVLKQVRADAKEFGLVLDTNQEMSIRNFIVYGISSTTKKLGQGERRAVVRDYMETVHRADFVWSDIERLTTGLIPLVRNLALERQNVNKALPVFIDIFGHAPNFKVAKENLAWNTLLYRIRFPRDLVKERIGIKAFYVLYKHYPTTPFGWSVVRALGYVK